MLCVSFFSAADIHRLKMVQNATEAQKISRSVNKHIGLVPRDSNTHGIGSGTTEVSPEMSEISAALGITSSAVRHLNVSQNGRNGSQTQVASSPSNTDTSAYSSGDSGCSTSSFFIPVYPEKLESSPNVSMSGKKCVGGERLQNGSATKGPVQNATSASKINAQNRFATKSTTQRSLNGSNTNGYVGINLLPSGNRVCRPRSANGKKHPNEVGLVVDGNGLKDDNRSKSAGDFNKMYDLSGMTSEEWINSSVKLHPTSFEFLRKRTNSGKAFLFNGRGSNITSNEK